MTPYLAQIAFSISDMRRTVRFYRDVLGLEDAGEVTAFRGPSAEYVQGVKGIASRTHWLQDGRRKMQLEFFEFEHPPRVHIPSDRRACDIGITRVAFEVVDIESALDMARTLGSTSVQGPMSIEGRNHAVIKDPDGIPIELIEAPGGFPTGLRSRIAGVAKSVSDLDTYVKLYTDGLSQTLSDRPHAPIDPLLGMEDARRKTVVVDGELAWIELSEYSDPRPKQRRDGHLLTDIGLSHIAYSVSDFTAFKTLFAKLVEGGWLRPHNPKPMYAGNLTGVMYSKDREDFTIETLYMSPLFHGMFGFRPPGALDRLAQSVMNAFTGLIYGGPGRPGSG